MSDRQAERGRPAAETLWPGRAETWRLRSRALRFGRRPLLVGILNVTPDSFSDGGRFLDPQAAIEQGLRMQAEGADVIDVGGESTRPYSEPVAADAELARVVPVVRALSGRLSIPISIDTTKAVVARAALDAGAEIINDVSAMTVDPQMLPLAAGSGAAVCLMHMQGTPTTMQDQPAYRDVVTEVHAYLAARRDAALAAGVERQRIALDPGIGFGKTHQHNLTLLAHCGRFLDLGCPVLVGHSRKGFIGKVVADKAADRTPGTIGVALALARQGVPMLRVHDVAAVRQALLLFDAAGGLDEEELILEP